MTSLKTFLSAVIALLVTSWAVASGVDRTLEPGARGPEVVAAVVGIIRSRCIFSEDHFFLRRLALVSSDNGNNHSLDLGGIWQVSQTHFAETQAKCNSSLLSSVCNLNTLHVDWRTGVKWADLNKPLYSGVAATLYTLLKLDGNPMPAEISQQATFYASAFGGNSREFSSTVNRFEHGSTQELGTDCKDKMDLIFVVENSDRIFDDDFQPIKSFVAGIVEGLNIENGDVRVAMLVYGSLPGVVLKLGQITNKPAIITNITGQPKHGGGTLTDRALAQAAWTLFDDSSGSRNDAKKVAVLVTSGHSEIHDETVKAADRIKALGATLLVVGIRDYNRRELLEVASSRACSHVVNASDVSTLGELISPVRFSLCQASFVQPQGAIGIPIEFPISDSNPNTPTPATSHPDPRTPTAATNDPHPHVPIPMTFLHPRGVLRIEVNCGQLDIYVSYSDPNPSPIKHDYHTNAFDGSPAFINMTSSAMDDDDTVYVTVESRRSNPACTPSRWTFYPESSVRLTNGSSPHDGRLEILKEGDWRAVCYNNFKNPNALPICAMLNYTGSSPDVSSTTVVGEDEGLLTNVQCHGNQTTPYDCQSESLGRRDCAKGQVVWIDCQPAKSADQSGSASKTALIAGLTGGLLGAAAIAATAGLIAKLKKNKIGQSDYSDPQNGSQTDLTSAMWDANAPTMRVPTDHRLTGTPRFSSMGS